MKKSNYWIFMFFIIIFFVIIFGIIAPEFLFFAMILYFIFSSWENNNKKENIKKKKKHSKKLDKTKNFDDLKFLEELVKQDELNEKWVKLINWNYSEVEELLLLVYLENKDNPNQKLLEERQKDIFIQYALEDKFDIQEKLLNKVYKEFLEMEGKDNWINKVIKNNKKTKKEKKTYKSSYKSAYKNKNYNEKFKSIWDDYESVINNK